MAIKRTRQHKMTQAIKLQEAQRYSFTEVEKKSGLPAKKAVNQFESTNMFGYSLQLIKQDIIKTGIVAVIVVSLLAVIFWLDIR